MFFDIWAARARTKLQNLGSERGMTSRPEASGLDGDLRRPHKAALPALAAKYSIGTGPHCSLIHATPRMHAPTQGVTALEWGRAAFSPKLCPRGEIQHWDGAALRSRPRYTLCVAHI